MRNLFLSFRMAMVAVALLVAVSSCTEFDAPEVSVPELETVQIGASVDLTFTYAADAGFASSSVTATNGTATVTTDGVVGETTGTIVVSFTGGSSEGAGSVVLSVKDAEDAVTLGTAVLDVVAEETEIDVTANITADETWETGKTYTLGGRITVESDATLTIEPGVVVKGEAGTGANATALLVARGGKLMAEGTASSPIIFTSVADEIEPGQIASPNLDPTLNGLWGGIIILGKAPISADDASMQIEGIPPSDTNGLYGGTDAADNSGSIKYISIRHGGANIGEGNEINGLTLGGVGSSTTIENVEIVSNQDDGIEWFGGTVSVKNAIVWNTGDDAIDTDQAWSGTLDNFVVVNPGDECFELDGAEGTAVAEHTIKNGHVKVEKADGLADLDNKGENDPGNSFVTMMNIYFYDITIDEDGTQDFDDYPAELTASNIEVTLPDGKVLTDLFKKGTDAFTTAVAAGANTVGADLSKFDTWSWTAVSGALD